MGLRLLAIVCLVGAAFAGPLQKERSQCATHCQRSPHQKFDYEIGKSYTYEYRGENVISAAGKPKQKSSIEGIAVIHVQDKCEMILQLKNLRVQQKLSHEEIQELTRKLESPIHFAYQDGKVEHVCPGHEEDHQSLNIKKGLISAFINTMTKLDTPQEVKEFDSLGNCVTHYTVKYVNGLEIQKEKSLKSCTNRHSSLTALITNPYENPNSKLHTLPIFPDEELVCKQLVEDKIFKSVECSERAQIKPLKQRESVIKFEGELKLTLLSISTSQRLPTSTPTKKETILYSLEEHKDAKSSERETEQLMREMCAKNEKSLDSSISKDFVKLVGLVRNLKYSDLSKIHSSLKNGRICSSKKVRDVFVDTLPMAGTAPCIKLMVELVESKEISGLKAKFWPASLALIPKPSRETLSEVIPLVRQQPSAIVLLGVSAMVHRYCSTENCDHEQSVQEITSILRQQLGEQCSNENESQVLAALKAFGNMGYHGSAEHCILACAQNKDKSTRLRLAAIDAFRRIHKKRPEELLSIYTDSQESSEIRISAFSSVIKQADAQQLRTIKITAEEETDDQVSGYVSTSLKNMRKTSSPLKKHVKHHLKAIQIKTPKVNYWENSKNIEISTFSETFNVGGSAESDIIHSQDSKIPRSMKARVDLDVLNSNMNIFEAGIRAEGLEGILKKLIGLKDKIPQKPSWNFFSQNKILDEAEVSAFLRTMDTEIFDLSASDLSGVGEMIQIADLMAKLAEGRATDFSHSFLFMNSEFLLPSVTGRSYSFGITGSATLGLTASTKLDFMHFPRNTDAKIHFQPSLNVEVSTTVGIQSNKNRPDIKLTSTMHLESNIAAKFNIKDGHLAIASISLPSENVVMAKVSSNVEEIDAHHQEKPVFESMQKKIDYCFDKLHKPLGLSVCGKLEVPKPFLMKSFPFIHGVGNAEFFIKKSDSQIQSYELKLEGPRHHTPMRKYKVSFDTPGSSISRKFSAELDIKETERSHKDYSLEVRTPFKNAGASGSYTQRPNLIEGSLEIHGSSARLISVNVSGDIISSPSKKVIKPSLTVTIGDNRPMHLNGMLSVTKGRKQMISFDIQASKYNRKPLSLKGSLTKEGHIILSKKAEWKISSEFAVDTGKFKAHVRSALEKQSKQAQTVSASFETEYQRGSQKHSMKFSSTSQKSSLKHSTNAQFQSTQLPSACWSLKWEMQGKPSQSFKNDINLRYGSNPERTYISIKQSSNLPESSNVVLKAPQFNIDSELNLIHKIDTSDTRAPKFHIEADLSYRPDKHIKGVAHVHVEDLRPLKANSRFELEYPGGRLIYTDEITETSLNKFEGKNIIQWKDDKKVELSYRLNNLGEEPHHHLEFETSLKFPSRHSPLSGKGFMKMSYDYVTFEFSGTCQQHDKYSTKLHFEKYSAGHLEIHAPKLDGHLKVHKEENKMVFDLDMNSKGRSPRHIVSHVDFHLEELKKAFEFKVLWDADRQPNKRVILFSEVEMTDDSYSATSKVQVTDLIDVALTESGKLSLLRSQGKLEVSLRNHEPFAIDYDQVLLKDQFKSLFKYSRNHVEKLELKLIAKSVRREHGKDLTAIASLISLDNSLENKELEMTWKQQRSGSSTSLRTLLRLQSSSRKTYAVEMDSQYSPNGMEVKAEINTPHHKYSKQSALMSVRKTENSVSSSLSVELPESKILTLSSVLERKNHELSSTLVLKSFLDAVRDVKVHLSLDNHHSKKNLLSYLDVNRERRGEIEASLSKSSYSTDIKASLKVSPIRNFPYQGLIITAKKSRTSLEYSSEVLMHGDKKISLISQLKKERSEILATATLTTPFDKVKSIDASLKKTRSSIELSGSAEYSGDKKVSVSSHVSKERSKLSATASLKTPYKIKEAKAHISVEKLHSKKSLLAYIDSNGERKGDIEISMSATDSGMEIQSRLKTVRTREVSAHAKLEKSGKSFSLSTKIVKGAARLLSEKRSIPSESLSEIILDLQASREHSSEKDEYSLKLSGPISPITLKALTSRRESSALNIEVSACRETQHSQCYSLKTVHKALRNSEGYHRYQRISLDIEKSVDHSSEKVATVNVILTASDHDYKSKFIVESQGKNYGYEVRIHRREHDDDHCSIDSHIFMPDRTSRFRASILHKSSLLSLEVELVPDSSNVHKALRMEVKLEENRRENHLSGYLKLSHPKSEKPILLTGRVQKEGMIPIKGKLELHYSSTGASRDGSKMLTLELDSVLERRTSGMKSISWKIYNEDQSLDVSLEMKKEMSRDHSLYSYDWSCKTRSGQRKGGMSIKLSHKKNGRPKHIDIKYYTPSVDLKIEGRSTNEISSMVVMSKGQLVKEITIKTTENCIELKAHRSGPFLESIACINKREGEAVKFISLETYYRRHKCLDVSVGIEPENPAFMDINVDWKKEELSRALSELSGLSDILHDRSLHELEEELKAKFRHFKDDVVLPRYRDLVRRLKHWEREQLQRIRDLFRHHRRMLKDQAQRIKGLKNTIMDWLESLIPMDYIEHEVIRPLVQAFKCLMDTYFQLAVKHIPDVLNVIVELTKEQFEYCLKKFCTKGTFCYDLQRTYHRYGWKQTKKLLHKKIQETRHSWREFINFFNPIPRIYRAITFTIRLTNEILENLFGKFAKNRLVSRLIKFGKRLEDKLRQRAIELIDRLIERINDIFKRAERDEDFRTAKSMIEDIIRKLKELWRKRSKIVKKGWQPMKREMIEKCKILLQDRVKLFVFEPKQGMIKIQFRHPLRKHHIQIAENAMAEAIKKKRLQ